MENRRICAPLNKKISAYSYYPDSNGPCYVEEKVELVEITEEEVWMALKRMKTGRALGIDEVYTQMIIAAEGVGVSWTTRLLNILVCLSKGSIRED